MCLCGGAVPRADASDSSLPEDTRSAARLWSSARSSPLGLPEARSPALGRTRCCRCPPPTRRWTGSWALGTRTASIRRWGWRSRRATASASQCRGPQTRPRPAPLSPRGSAIKYTRRPNRAPSTLLRSSSRRTGAAQTPVLRPARGASTASSTSIQRASSSSGTGGYCSRPSAR